MTLSQLPLIMLRALIITIIIEGACAWTLGVRDMKGQKVVLLANLMTNPIVVSVGAAVVLFAGNEYLFPVTMALEICVIVAEAIVYKYALDYDRNPWLLSLLCNVASYIIGEILNNHIF